MLHSVFASSLLSLVLAPLLFLGCGDDGGGNGGAIADASADASSLADAGPFTLASNAYMEGGVIPRAHTCQGANVSPQLSWSNPPEGTEAFALVFKDLSIDFLHSAIWDIPVSRLELPEDVDTDFEPADVPGAKQPDSYANTRGYAGPCPPSTHNYEFRLHAVDTAALVGLGQQSTREQVVSAIVAASIGSASLTGTFDPDNP